MFKFNRKYFLIFFEKKTLDECYENVKRVLKENLKKFKKVLDRLKNIMLKGCFIMNFFKKILIKNKK